MAFRAVLDACVLYPFSLRDLLLRLAEHELYDPVWSARILDEMARNLVADGLMSMDKAGYFVALLREAFEDAEVAESAVAQLEPVMTNQSKDRHVLAAAVAGHAEAVITTNIKDFGQEACAPLGVEASHPDDFLLVLLAKQPGAVVAVLQEQVRELRKPPVSMGELLDRLDTEVPRFVEAVRSFLADSLAEQDPLTTAVDTADT